MLWYADRPTMVQSTRWGRGEWGAAAAAAGGAAQPWQDPLRCLTSCHSARTKGLPRVACHCFACLSGTPCNFFGTSCSDTSPIGSKASNNVTELGAPVGGGAHYCGRRSLCKMPVSRYRSRSARGYRDMQHAAQLDVRPPRTPTLASQNIAPIVRKMCARCGQHTR